MSSQLNKEKQVDIKRKKEKIENKLCREKTNKNGFD